MPSSPQTTLVTSSYAPDIERCKRLCKSVSRFVENSISHLLVVPERDRKLFSALENERTRIITVESLLPRFVWQLPFQDRWWLTLYSLPVRGWIMQQVTKLSVPLAVDTDSIMFVDSDVVFIRPFNPDQTIVDGRIRLFSVPGGGDTPTHRRWHRKAGALIGLVPSDYYGSTYIGQLVSWHCETVRKLHQQIEKTQGRPWQIALFNTLHFSEYILYGIFVESFLKNSRDHYSDKNDLCHCSWHYTHNGQCDIDDFFAQLPANKVAILVQSNLGIDPEQYERKIETLSQGSD